MGGIVQAVVIKHRIDGGNVTGALCFFEFFRTEAYYYTEIAKEHLMLSLKFVSVFSVINQ